MSSPHELPSTFAATFAAAKRKRLNQNSNVNERGHDTSTSNGGAAVITSSSHRNTTTPTTSTSPSLSHQQTLSSSSTPTPSICLLPQHVIDQIAAGEVVQRPVSVVKELLENSLDAGATHIVVHVERGGLSKLSISDNGCGIAKTDLPLLATRHATSKLTSVDDFETLQTFGFRGEAVAATSMVSRLLTVTTRTAKSSVAYTQTYQNGQPSTSNAKACARTVGTTIVVQDLFHNVPHRQKAYSKKESEEYAKILAVVQQYAIHYPTVGFVCQRQRTTSGKTGGVLIDCNTSQIPAVKALLQSRDGANKTENVDISGKDHRVMEATKQILSHVLEAHVRDHLLQFQCSSAEASTTATATGSTSSQYHFQFAARVYFTTPEYAFRKGLTQQKQQQGRFISFLNHRLVDLPALKRAMEDVYVDFTVGGTIGKTNNAAGNIAKPVLVVNLTVPGAQVDVNVHPSKRQVALMYQEDVIKAITSELRQQLETRGQSFATQSVAIRNPYSKMKTAKRKEPSCEESDTGEDGQKHDGTEAIQKAPHGQPPLPSTETSTCTRNGKSSQGSTKKPKLAPSKLIRTNKATPAGAIEPFLVPTQPNVSQMSTSSTQSRSSSIQNEDVLVTPKRRHLSDCPLSSSTLTSSLDMSQPGAFASAMRCTCPPEAARQTVLVKQPVVRPKKVKATHCEYVSIKTLRKRILKHQCADTTAHMRKAFFMGVLSHQRSLVQCGEELVMINHMEMAKELFYQLALARFGGGAVMAHFGEVGGNGGLHIQTAIEQALQYEDDLILTGERSQTQKASLSVDIDKGRDKADGMLEVNETNRKMARMAASVLLEKSDMLEEYFSIRIERLDPDSTVEDEDVNNTIDAVLTGLPVLLDGHSPQPHGLPIFLLRLATQVDWDEERPCFQGICKELGDYYAMLPSESDDVNAFVRHNLFPALSYLLIPQKRIRSNGHFTSMTKLSTLYKVFERC